MRLLDRAGVTIPLFGHPERNDDIRPAAPRPGADLPRRRRRRPGGTRPPAVSTRHSASTLARSSMETPVPNSSAAGPKARRPGRRRPTRRDRSGNGSSGPGSSATEELSARSGPTAATTCCSRSNCSDSSDHSRAINPFCRSHFWIFLHRNRFARNAQTPRANFRGCMFTSPPPARPSPIRKGAARAKGHELVHSWGRPSVEFSKLIAGLRGRKCHVGVHRSFDANHARQAAERDSPRLEQRSGPEANPWCPTPASRCSPARASAGRRR